VNIFIYFLFLCILSSCSEPRSLCNITFQLQEQITLQKTKLPSKKISKNIEQLLDELFQHPKIYSEEQKKIISDALEIYQFHYFAQPTKKKYAQLQKYYNMADTGNIVLPPTYLKNTLDIAFFRSQQAPTKWQQLQLFWKQNPKQLQEFLTKLDKKWEVGGVILETELQEFQVIFIEDKKRDIYQQYVQEFDQNDFRHLPQLEQKFIERLRFHVMEDEKAKKYFEVVLKSAKRHFALLHVLSKKSTWTQHEKEQVQKSKNKLYYYGLKRKLTKQTYHGDITAFIHNKNVVFFFHTHPHHPDLIFAKHPSAQDKIQTFRLGPSLVFDIHENRVDAYLVNLGKTFRKITL